MCTNPGHNRAEFTEKLAVQGGKGAAGESELGDTIMREERVSVLQEGDHNKPMVDPNLQLSSFRFKAEKWIQPEVRNQISLPDSGEAHEVDADGENGKPDGDTDT